jgi:hypothetical protein
MSRNNQPQPVYQYIKGGPLPVPKRDVVMAGVVANNHVNRSVFQANELIWIDGRIAEMLADPTAWVDACVSFLRLRAAGLAVKYTHTTKKTFTGRILTTKGHFYNSEFLATFEVYLSVLQGCLQAQNRARFAFELRKKPYEAEVLRGNHYTSSVINGVLTENGGLMLAPTPTAIPVIIQCAYCARNFDQTEIKCPWCGAPR